jgi:hypothetical protein|tara:strand:- start:928 stop:1089 length:162 start_codon:yes stop_codon:yes gene_type:complete
MDIFKEWSAQVLANFIVPSTDYQKGLVKWQESHGVPNSSTWWGSLLLDLLPLG